MQANPSRPSARFSRSLLSGILLAAASSAHAQTTFYWDADGDATTGTGGPGTWDAASSLWRNGTDTGPLAPWPNTDPAVDTAQFAGTAGKVTLNSDSANLNITRIVFATTGYEIAGPASGTATLNVSGTSPSRITTNTGVSATVSAGISGPSTINLNKAGAGTLTLSGANTLGGRITVSANDVNGGILNISGDQSAATGGYSVSGISTVNFQSGSTVAVAASGSILMNNSAGNKTLNVFGTVTSGGLLEVRGRSTVNLESGTDWTQNGNLIVRPLTTAYGATMNVKTGASFTYGGTSDIILAKSNSSGNNDGGASINLSGGTFTTGKAFTNASAATANTGSTRLTFSNGGTLKLSAAINPLIIQGSTPFDVVINTGGGVIDTNTRDTAINVAITGTGGLTKAGEGTLTLSGLNTYVGNTTVTGGTLRLDAANTGNDTSTVTIGNSGVLLLAFAGTDAVEKLVIGSTLQGPGVYGHGSTGATNGSLGVGALDARFAEGTGTLTVGTPFQNFMAAYPALTGDDALPDSDPDGDGLSNAAEFIMGGTAPNSGSAANRPVSALTGGHLTLSLLVPTGTTFAGSPSPSATVKGVQVAVGGSLDLATFARGVEETALNPALPAASSGYEWHTFRLSDPVSSQPRGFLRASFSAP